VTRFGIYEKKKIAVFDRYAPKLHGVFVLYGGTGDVFRLETNIEPYTGQDKPSLDRIKEMNSEPMRIVPVYPYTVILKSGKMIGITEQGGKSLIKSRESLQGEPLKISQSATLQLGDVLDFTNGEIAAIVPTENLML